MGIWRDGLFGFGEWAHGHGFLHLFPGQVCLQPHFWDGPRVGTKDNASFVRAHHMRMAPERAALAVAVILGRKDLFFFLVKGPSSSLCLSCFYRLHRNTGYASIRIGGRTFKFRDGDGRGFVLWHRLVCGLLPEKNGICNLHENFHFFFSQIICPRPLVHFPPFFRA